MSQSFTTLLELLNMNVVLIINIMNQDNVKYCEFKVSYDHGLFKAPKCMVVKIN